MATFRLEVKSFRKGKAEGLSHYINRRGMQAGDDLVARGHFNLPSFADDEPHLLWAASDKYERSNGSAAREYIVSLPRELPNEKNIELTSRLAHSLAGSRPCEFAMHRAPGAISGEDHPHAHIVITDRVPDDVDRTPKVFFSRANTKDPAAGGARKLSGGKSPKQMAIQLLEVKAEVASTINEVLAKNGISQRVNHRSNKQQGIQKTTERRLHPATVRELCEEGKQALLKKRRQNA